MSIIVVGCSHSTAPLPVLESLSVPQSDLAAVLTRLREVTREALVLSTCNRAEVYAVVGHWASGAELVTRMLGERAGVAVSDLREVLYVHSDRAAVRHGLRVASGLESMVLGEDQIQAQWKRALAHARAQGTLGPVLDRLGAAALSCGKRVRAFTGIGKHSVSLESLAVRAARQRLGSLDDREIVIVGTGESASLIARQLRRSARTTVVSRSLETAEQFALEMNVHAVSGDDLPRALVSADAVFCCTSAPHAVLTAEHLRARGVERLGQPLVCVDLGMPRDVDPSVAKIAGVSVVSLVELAALSESHREERRQHLPQAEAIVEGEVGRFLEWRAARGASATITRLQKHADAIVDAELSRAWMRLGGMSERDRDAVAALARRVVRKLLHPSTKVLKGHPEAENIALALECAFGLSGTEFEEQLPAAPVAADASLNVDAAS